MPENSGELQSSISREVDIRRIFCDISGKKFNLFLRYKFCLEKEVGIYITLQIVSIDFFILEVNLQLGWGLHSLGVLSILILVTFFKRPVYKETI